jgi:hypothetical protein
VTRQAGDGHADRRIELAATVLLAIAAVATAWAAYQSARWHGEVKLTAFYRKRFRPEFRPAFGAWVATKPRTNPAAPLSPFAMPQYKLAATARAGRKEAQAAAFSKRVGRFIQRADNYSLAVVLFAASLFFAGISTRLRATAPRMAVLALGYAMFLTSMIWIATFPVSLSV